MLKLIKETSLTNKMGKPQSKLLVDTREYRRRRQLSLQEAYRQGTLNPALLARDESELLFTPPIEEGITLVDQYNNKYYVEKVMCHKALLREPTVVNEYTIVHTFDFDPKFNTLAWSSYSTRINMTPIFDREAQKKGLLSVDYLNYYDSYIVKDEKSIITYGRFRSYPTVEINHIVRQMKKTRTLHEEVRQTYRKYREELVAKRKGKNRGRTIDLSVAPQIGGEGSTACAPPLEQPEPEAQGEEGSTACAPPLESEEGTPSPIYA